jgi:hypothetical protein
MSETASNTLNLFVGQCGSQIGSSLAHLTGPNSRDGHGTLFIDSEPRVVAPLVSSSTSRIPFLPKSSAVWDVNGRGNNWAWGYANAASRLGSDQPGYRASAPNTTEPGGTSSSSVLYKEKKASGSGKSLIERTLNAIRRHTEALDRFESILLVHSTGGGTGSGLGSKVLEVVRQENPKATILAACIAPFSSGDTPLQHYNSVLSLAHANEHADAVLFFDNDDALRRARMVKRPGGGLSTSLASGSSASAIADARSARRLPPESTQVDTDEMNDIIAQSLAGILLPIRTRKKLQRRKRGGRKEEADVSDIGPGWHDVSKDAERPIDDAFSGKVDDPSAQSSPIRDSRVKPTVKAFEKAKDDDEDEFGERGGWIASSTRSKGVASTNGQTSSAAERNVSQILSSDSLLSSASSAANTVVGVLSAFDALALVQDLVPRSSQKFIDLRTAYPLSSSVSGKGVIGADSPSASWIALTESLIDQLPRYDRSGRLVNTWACKAIARGATQIDCDSVDPSLAVTADPSVQTQQSHQPKQHSLGARVGLNRVSPVGMKPLPTPWPGLPSTSEWERVGMVLSRALTFAPGVSVDKVRSGILSPLPVFPVVKSPQIRIPNHVRTLTLASNNDAFVSPLLRTLTRAEELLAVGAYVHWYERYNVGADDIAEAVNSLLNVIDTYRPGGSTEVRLPTTPDLHFPVILG